MLQDPDAGRVGERQLATPKWLARVAPHPLLIQLLPRLALPDSTSTNVFRTRRDPDTLPRICEMRWRHTPASCRGLNHLAYSAVQHDSAVVVDTTLLSGQHEVVVNHGAKRLSCSTRVGERVGDREYLAGCGERKLADPEVARDPDALPHSHQEHNN